MVSIHLVWHRIDTSMRSKPRVSISPRWRPKPEMTWHPRSMPTGYRKTRRTEKPDVNSMHSVKRKYIVFSIIGYGIDHV